MLDALQQHLLVDCGTGALSLALCSSGTYSNFRVHVGGAGCGAHTCLRKIHPNLKCVNGCCELVHTLGSKHQYSKIAEIESRGSSIGTVVAGVVCAVLPTPPHPPPTHPHTHLRFLAGARLAYAAPQYCSRAAHIPLCMPFASTHTSLCVLAWTAVQPMFMLLMLGLLCSMPSSQAAAFLYYVCACLVHV